MAGGRGRTTRGRWSRAAGALLLLAAVGLPDCAQAQPLPTTETAALPFRPAPPLRSYVAIRRMESVNDRHHKEAWLLARTELHDDGTFTYRVLDEGGSELIRKRVLREALDKEVQVHRDGRARRGGLTADNYLFSTPTTSGGHVRIGMEPRKREDMLMKGALLTSTDGELLRVEGELVKRPSFWTRSVYVVRDYARVAGAHVPVRLEMTAQVRIVGPSRLTMTYQYEQINGRPVIGGLPRDASSVGSVATREPR